MQSVENPQQIEAWLLMHETHIEHISNALDE
jgi:hypothetical protein